MLGIWCDVIGFHWSTFNEVVKTAKPKLNFFIQNRFIDLQLWVHIVCPTYGYKMDI